MSSKDRSEDLRLERDLPTTAADVAILRQLRRHRQLSFKETLELLSKFDLFPQNIPDRPSAEGWEPFEL